MFSLFSAIARCIRRYFFAFCGRVRRCSYWALKKHSFYFATWAGKYEQKCLFVGGNWYGWHQTHTRLLYTYQTHTRLLGFWRDLVANTYAFVVQKPNTYAFAVLYTRTKHNPHTFHTHSTHSTHTYALAPRSLANTYAFVVSRHQTHTRLSFPGTKHIRVWRSFQICQANTYAFVVKLEQIGPKFPKPTRPNRNPSNGCRRTFFVWEQQQLCFDKSVWWPWVENACKILQRSPKAYIFYPKQHETKKRIMKVNSYNFLLSPF